MKKSLFILLLAVTPVLLPAQQLLDLYKKGTVKLVPDPEYARGNAWNDIFKNASVPSGTDPADDKRSLLVMPDGSVIVNNHYSAYYSRFSPMGKFEKEFGILNSKGESLKKVKDIAGILNNNTFFTDLDNMGNMICFDFNGNYIKSLKLDYMARQMIPMPGNKIAVAGWVIWSDRFRDFVSIVDYNTNDEKIIWKHDTPRHDDLSEKKLFNYKYRLKNGGIMHATTMPFSGEVGLNSLPYIANLGDKLVVAVPDTGDILIYDLDGKLISKDKIGWDRNYLSVGDQKEIQKKAIEKFKKARDHYSESMGDSREARVEGLNYMINEMESDLNKITDPIPMPYFSTIIKDSDGNLLFFEYPKEEGANKFNVWVYHEGGKFVCQSSFTCDEYNLEINPSKMVFRNGYLYGLQHLKKADGEPLRLIRFTLTQP